MSQYLSRDVCNDNIKLYRFERTSGLPADYFKPRRISPDAVVFIVCIVGAAVALLFT